MQAGKAVFSWRLFVDDGYFDVVEVEVVIAVGAEYSGPGRYVADTVDIHLP